MPRFCVFPSKHISRLHSRARGITAAVLLGLGACDAPLAPTAQSPTAPVSPSQVHHEDEFRTIPRFEIDVETKGTLTPRSPIVVHLRVRALLPTASASIRVISPEIESAKANRWQAGPPIESGRVLPRLASWERSMDEGEEFRTSVVVRVDAPGYYRLSVTARKMSDEFPMSGGRPVEDFVHEEVWLLVTDSGGVSTRSFDRSMVPSDFQPGPGVFRRRPARQATDSRAEAGTGMESAVLSPTNNHLAVQ